MGGVVVRGVPDLGVADAAGWGIGFLAAGMIARGVLAAGGGGSPGGLGAGCGRAGGGGCLRRGELAVLPGLEQGFQAGEDAGEAGDDHGVDGASGIQARFSCACTALRRPAICAPREGDMDSMGRIITNFIR